MSTTGAAPALMIVDGTSLLDRAFYSVPASGNTTRDGRTTNAIHGFTTMLLDLLDQCTPTTRVTVVFDSPGRSFRVGLHPAYNANRTIAAELAQQESVIRDILVALGIRAVTTTGFEAADIAASLTGTAAGTPVVIASTDDRVLQLVCDTVTVLRMSAPGAAPTRMGPAEVHAKYGVTPSRYADYLALAGDQARGLSRIPGVRDKTTIGWIEQFGDLDTLIEHAAEVSGRAGNALRAHLPTVQLNRTLTALATDAAVPPLDDLERATIDRAAIERLFSGLELPLVRSRILDTLSGTATGYAVATVQTGTASVWLADNTSQGHRVGVAFSTDTAGEVTAIAFATSAGAIAYLNLAAPSATDNSAVGAWLADTTIPKALHDAKPIIAALHQRGWALGGLDNDTALAAYLLHPGEPTSALDALTARYLHRDLAAAAPTNQGSLFAPTTSTADALGAAARAVHDLAEHLDAELARAGMAQLFHELEIPVLAVLADIEQTGVAVDTERLQQLRTEFVTVADEATTAAADVLGKPINLGSGKQLQHVLFDELALPKTRRTKTGFSTDATALSNLYEQTKHPFLSHVLTHRDASSLRAITESLLKAVGTDGRIHTTLQQTKTATGRLSSTEPNLQNIPIRTDVGRRIREAFVATEQQGLFMTADYSQIEMRIMAHASDDRAMIAAFNSGEDLHRYVASEAFDVPIADVTPEQRRRVKAMSYGLAYGLTARGLAAQLGISMVEARTQRANYFARFGGVRDYLYSLVEQARTSGYTETLLGRRRYLPDLTNSSPTRVEAAERAALNAPIQGSAADIIKLAMRDVAATITARELRSKMILQIHDELLFEVAADERDQLQQLVTDAMTSAITLSVPLEVSIGVGRTWAEAAH